MSASLEHERDELLRRLRDLETEHASGDLDDTDYRNLRDDYTARAAAVLRRLERDEAPSTAPGDSGDDVPAAGALPAGGGGGRRGRTRVVGDPRGRTRRTRVVAAVALVALAAGGTGYALAGSSGERTATDEATGSLPEGSVDRITRAQLLVSDGKVLEAIRVYDDLLEDDPENPVALAQRGWLLSRVDPKLVDSGLASIERAIEVDPQYPEAHFFRGMILWRAKSQPAVAAESFQRAIDAGPPADVRATLEEVKAQATADAAAAAGGTTTP